MKRVGYIYEKICDIDLIKRAIRKAAQGKTQKHYIAKVLEKIDYYAEQIKIMLETDSVVLSENRYIELFDRSCSKLRQITVPNSIPTK